MKFTGHAFLNNWNASFQSTVHFWSIRFINQFFKNFLNINSEHKNAPTVVLLAKLFREFAKSLLFSKKIGNIPHHLKQNYFWREERFEIDEIYTALLNSATTGRNGNAVYHSHFFKPFPTVPDNWNDPIVTSGDRTDMGGMFLMTLSCMFRTAVEPVHELVTHVQFYLSSCAANDQVPTERTSCLLIKCWQHPRQIQEHNPHQEATRNFDWSQLFSHSQPRRVLQWTFEALRARMRRGFHAPGADCPWRLFTNLLPMAIRGEIPTYAILSCFLII